MPKRWLIAASHPLESIFKVSAYHLTMGLARRAHNDVLYLCAPISPLHRARPSGTSDLALRERLWRTGPVRHAERLLEYCPRTYLPYVNGPFFGSRLVARRSLAWTRPPLAAVLREAGFDRPDVLMIVNPQFAPLLDIAPAGLTLYRNIDELRGMAHVPASMLEIERDVARRVDAVVTVSVVQQEKMAALGARRVFRLPHGVDLAAFQGPLPPEPAEYASIPRPRVVFVGALTQWVDGALAVEVARRLPRVSFVFIGPADPPFPDCLRAPNVTYLGPRPHERVPAYLRHADAAIIPFGRSPIVESAHPLKLLTYLAAGLPTVCTPWRELDAMGLPVRRGRTPEEFARALEAVLEAPPDREALAASVREYDWERIVDRLEQIVGQVGNLPGGC